ncbi:MAG: hypothetical protein IPJ75_18990 [Ignavibacteriales bacterium]|nr:hypothetical protein [Ignavibacteriales bacterium]
MLTEIFQVILYLSASALCVALIVYLKKLTDSVQQMQKDLGELTNKFEPLIDSLQTLSGTLQHTTSEVNEQLEKTGWVIDQVKMRLESLFSFEEKVKESLESPVDTLLTNLTALKGGVLAFFRAFFLKK